MILTETIGRAATRSSDRRERIVAFGIALVLIATAVGWSFTGHAAMRVSPALVGAAGTALTLGQLAAAMLLIWRARLIGDGRSADIAASFVYAVPVAALYALAFLRIEPLAGAPGVTSAWTWEAWRIGWPSFIIWYALRPHPRRGRVGRSVVVALACSVVAIALALSGRLPDLYGPANEGYSAVGSVVNVTAILVAAYALLCVLRIKPMTTLNTWLAVMLAVAATRYVVLAFHSPHFAGAPGAGWMFLGLGGIAIFIFALVLEFARLLERSLSLDRYVAMAQFASTIVFLSAPSGACVYVNRRWQELTGQRADEALGEGWKNAVHPDDLGVLTKFRAPGLAAATQYEYELRYRCADGTYRWHLATATPTFDAYGALDGWYGTSTDVDAQRRALDQLETLYEREHQIAQTLQAAFIPPFLPQVEGLAFEAVYRPALHEAELGGDWYDAFVLRDGRIALSIGDIAGHGLDAAIAMVRLRETLRAVTGLVDTDPASILQMADRAFKATHPDTIATAVFALYDPHTGRLVYACAGHPPPALLRDGRASFLPCNAGVPLGVEADAAFVSQAVVLEPRDTLVLYTDGLVEAARDIVLGEQRFAEMLVRHAGDAERLVNETLRGAQRDDVALLKISVLESAVRASWYFESDDAASATDARFSFTAHLRRRNVDPAVITIAEVVFGELVGNVVRHAPGPIEIELVWRSDRPLLTVRDRGPHFEIGDIKLPDDVHAENGRGLYMISTFASRPAVTPRFGGGNEVAVALVPAEAEFSSPEPTLAL
jgi:PAS domain S-box-containing protein